MESDFMHTELLNGAKENKIIETQAGIYQGSTWTGSQDGNSVRMDLFHKGLRPAGKPPFFICFITPGVGAKMAGCEGDEVKKHEKFPYLEGLPAGDRFDKQTGGEEYA